MEQEQTSISKRRLYGFAGALFGPAIFIYIVGHIVNTEKMPIWFNLSLLVLTVVIAIFSSRFSYRNTASFEKLFRRGVIVGSANAGNYAGAAAMSNAKESDLNKKVPAS